MNYRGMVDRPALRRSSPAALVRKMAERHPELRAIVGMPQLLAITDREGILVRFVDYSRSQHARLVRVYDQTFILINRQLSQAEQVMGGVHELCHYWRDDPGVMSYYSDDVGPSSAREEFADLFAWLVTSPARVHIKGVREEDF
jgi:Zn-dependent peptidase ImmA (M78 family)